MSRTCELSLSDCTLLAFQSLFQFLRLKVIDNRLHPAGLQAMRFGELTVRFLKSFRFDFFITFRIALGPFEFLLCPLLFPHLLPNLAPFLTLGLNLPPMFMDQIQFLQLQFEILLSEPDMFRFAKFVDRRK